MTPAADHTHAGISQPTHACPCCCPPMMRQVLVHLGVLTAAEAEAVVVTHVPAVRVGVAGAAELQLTGVMDAGVSPRTLLDIVKR